LPRPSDILAALNCSGIPWLMSAFSPIATTVDIPNREHCAITRHCHDAGQGCRHFVQFFADRSSPPRQIPSTRAPNTSDVRTTLSVCVESAIRAATAVLGTPPALSNSTALRKDHGGDTEDDRDNECSKHNFISVWSWVYRSATTPRSSSIWPAGRRSSGLLSVDPLRMARWGGCGRSSSLRTDASRL